MGELTSPSAEIEQELHDEIAEEYNRLGGTPIKMWSVRRAASFDPLWDEPSSQFGYDPLYGERAGSPPPAERHEVPDRKEWGFQGPWEVWGVVEFEEIEGQATGIEDSITTEKEAVAWIARTALDKVGAPYPKKGDVFEVRWTDAAGNIMFFDVTSAKRGGALNDSQTYIQFMVALKKRSKFDPSRRIDE